MLPAISTISALLSQGGLTSQVNGASSSNLTGTGLTSSATPTSGLQLSPFDNLMQQLNAASGSSTSQGTQSAGHVHGHHGHGGGGGGINALLQQLEELEDGTSALPGVGTTASTTNPSSPSTSSTSGISGNIAVGAPVTANAEATLNRLLQNLKLMGSSTNAAATNSGANAQSSLSLAQRLAQQGSRVGHMFSAVV
jgi:hypothetical protein